MGAAADGDAEIVELLLDRGARLDLRNEGGWTAEEMAREKGHEGIAAKLRAARGPG
jgi:ankyrin repeat protein